MTPQTEQKKKQKTTAGERLFDIMTYVGVGGFLNAAISVAISKWAEEPEKLLNSEKPFWQQMGKAADAMNKGLGKAAEGLEKTIKPLPIYGGAKAGFTSKNFIFGAVMGAGGWIVLPIIKGLEDHKGELVNHFDKMMGKTIEKDKDGKEIDRFADKPKQTWLSVIGGRTVAFFVPLMVALPLMDAYKDKYGKDIINEMANFGRKVVGKQPITDAAVMQKSWSRMFAGETFFTIIGITTLYIVSKTIAGMQQKKQGKAESGPEFEQKREAVMDQLVEHYRKPENAKAFGQQMQTTLAAQQQFAGQIPEGYIAVPTLNTAAALPLAAAAEPQTGRQAIVAEPQESAIQPGTQVHADALSHNRLLDIAPSQTIH